MCEGVGWRWGGGKHGPNHTRPFKVFKNFIHGVKGSPREPVKKSLFIQFTLASPCRQ